jgi:hypothetical protein
MTTVMCLKFGDKFSADYVNHLYAGVKRNSTVPFTFKCYTENPTGIHEDIVIEKLPDAKLSGWWYKLYLFSEEANNTGTNVFIDLDTIITSNIDDILTYDPGESLAVLQDVGVVLEPNLKENFGSGFMIWKGLSHTQIWSDFIQNPDMVMKSYSGGDQQWIQTVVEEFRFLQDIFPKSFRSFKWECHTGPKAGTRVICFHGKPLPHEAISNWFHRSGWGVGLPESPPQPWIKNYWKMT